MLFHKFEIIIKTLYMFIILYCLKQITSFDYVAKCWFCKIYNSCSLHKNCNCLLFSLLFSVDAYCSYCASCCIHMEYYTYHTFRVLLIMQHSTNQTMTHTNQKEIACICKFQYLSTVGFRNFTNICYIF